jgi:hypothetical protein
MVQEKRIQGRGDEGSGAIFGHAVLIGVVDDMKHQAGRGRDTDGFLVQAVG